MAANLPPVKADIPSNEGLEVHPGTPVGTHDIFKNATPTGAGVLGAGAADPTCTGMMMEPITHQETIENAERGNWTNQLEFLLASVGYVVGLGNIWRFPYIVYEYGGGSFLVAYWILFILVAFPTFFQEMALGQFSSMGPVAIFKNAVPCFRGLGICSVIVQAGTTFYFNAVFAYALFYTFASIQMQWTHCDSPWNSKVCFSIDQYAACVDDKPSVRWWLKGECYDEQNMTSYFDTLDACINEDRYKGDAPMAKCTLQMDLCFKGNFTIAAWLGGRLGANETVFLEQECRTWVQSKAGMDDKPLDKPLAVHLELHSDGQAEKTAALLRSRLHGRTMTDLMEEYCRHWRMGLASGCRQGDAPGKETGIIPCSRNVIRPKEVFSSQEFFNTHVHAPGATYTDSEGYFWAMPLSLLLASCLSGIGVYKGPKWVGKAVYVTAILPIVTIIILIVYVTQLPGHMEGIKWYLRTDWCTLMDPQMWLVALGQIFFSLGVGSGGLMTLASYNRFHTDIVKNTYIIALCNCLFSFITGFGIFGAVGYMAEQANTEVSEVLRGSGSSLAFVAIAQTVATMPVSQFWGILFFSTLSFLAVDSVFTMVETVLTTFYDAYPSMRMYRFEVVSIATLILFLCGMPFVTRGGMLWVSLMDASIYNWIVPMVAFFELVQICAIYGLRNLAKDIDMMLGGLDTLKLCGHKVWRCTVFRGYMMFAWMVTAPVGILVLMVTTFVYQYLLNEEMTLGSIKGVTTLVFMVSTPVILLVTCSYTAVKGRRLFKPTAEWGPALNEHRSIDPARYPPVVHIPDPNHAPSDLDAI